MSWTRLEGVAIHMCSRLLLNEEPSGQFCSYGQRGMGCGGMPEPAQAPAGWPVPWEMLHEPGLVSGGSGLHSRLLTDPEVPPGPPPG